MSNGSSYFDAGIGQIYRPPGQTWGGIPRFSNSQPNLGGHSIKSDVTSTLIEYKSSKNSPTNPKAEPWGGRLRHKGKIEARGHIVPKILGGSDTDRYNFISQNRSVNSGGYNQFGKRINNRLNDLGRIYDQNMRHYESLRGQEICLASPPPQRPYVYIQISLNHQAGRKTPGFPFRPSSITATAIFSDGTVITGSFSNAPNAVSRKGKTWRIYETSRLGR